MSEDKGLKDKFDGGLSLTVIIQLITLVVVLWMLLVSFNNWQDQLLVWMHDAEIERETNHKAVLSMLGSIEDLDVRVDNLEQYNTRKDPEFRTPAKAGRWDYRR